MIFLYFRLNFIDNFVFICIIKNTSNCKDFSKISCFTKTGNNVPKSSSFYLDFQLFTNIISEKIFSEYLSL
jgi:hypothetical protein